MAEQISKTKKKQWYSIVAPKQFENVVLGETLVYDPQSMVGKTLSHSLMNLTNDVKKQNINVHFKVTEVEGDKAKTVIYGYEIIPSSLKRFVRRNSEKIILSFQCETSDNISLRVKPLLVTRGDVKGSVAARLRHTLYQHIIKTIKGLTYDELINELISHKLQSGIRESLHKIYPLKICEIRYLGLEQKDRSAAKQESKVEAPAEVQQ